MQPSSGTPRAWFRWPCAAAFALVLAPGGVVIAQSGSANCEPSQERPPEQNTDSTFSGEQRINPCNGDPITFEGRTQNSFRTQTKRDCSMETRSRTRTEAKGIGTQAEYKLLEDHTHVTRFGPDGPPGRVVERRDERIIAQNKTGTLAVGAITPAAASWFQTARTDTKFDDDGNVVGREQTETRCRCKREDEVPDERCPSQATPPVS